jgi:hypothetical protein
MYSGVRVNQLLCLLEEIIIPYRLQIKNLPQDTDPMHALYRSTDRWLHVFLAPNSKYFNYLPHAHFALTNLCHVKQC